MGFPLVLHKAICACDRRSTGSYLLDSRAPTSIFAISSPSLSKLSLWCFHVLQVSDAERRQLAMFREENEITEEYHKETLKALGWTETDYAAGYKG